MQVLKTTLVLALVMLFAFALFAASTTPAAACLPASASAAQCIDRTILLRLTPTPAPTATPDRRGDSPDHALDIANKWTTIAPGASIWYKTPDSDGYRDIELWIDSPAQHALGLSLFSPDQQVGPWAIWKPVGRGTFNPGEPQHALTWVAAYARSGVWYALVQNYTNAPVSYQLAGNLSSADVRKCHGYWEPFPNGTMVYWIDCGHYTTVP
jgi:hypothetical protein